MENYRVAPYFMRHIAFPRTVCFQYLRNCRSELVLRPAVLAFCTGTSARCASERPTPSRARFCAPTPGELSPQPDQRSREHPAGERRRAGPGLSIASRRGRADQSLLSGECRRTRRDTACTVERQWFAATDADRLRRHARHRDPVQAGTLRVGWIDVRWDTFTAPADSKTTGDSL